MSSTFIPAQVLPHFDAVCAFMDSLPAEGAQEVGDYFKRYGDVLAGSKRDLAKAESIPGVELIPAMRRRLWTARIEPTDQNVMLATLVLERCRTNPANSVS